MKIAKSRLKELIKEEADSIVSHFQVNEENDPQITEEELKQLIKEEIGGLLNEWGLPDLFDPPEPAYKGTYGGRGRFITGDPEKVSDQLRSELEDTEAVRAGMQALDRIPFVDLDSPEDIPEAYLKAAAMLTLPFLFRQQIGGAIGATPSLTARGLRALRGTSAAEKAISAERAAQATRTTQHVPTPRQAPRRMPKEFESPVRPGETPQQIAARRFLERGSQDRRIGREVSKVSRDWTKTAEEAADFIAKQDVAKASKSPWWRLGRRGEKWAEETMKDPIYQPKIDPTKPDIYELGSLGRKQQILRALEKALRRKPPE